MTWWKRSCVLNALLKVLIDYFYEPLLAVAVRRTDHLETKQVLSLSLVPAVGRSFFVKAVFLLDR